MSKTGYCNGSDMLLYVGDKAVGHCTTHTVTYSSETKKRTVKPPASEPASSSLWSNSTVVGLSYSISADGLIFYDEAECGYPEMLKMWKAGQPVSVKCLHRGNSEKPYLSGKCIISSLEESHQAQDDSSYTIKLDNDGAPDVFNDTAFTDDGAAAASMSQTVPADDQSDNEA